MVLPPRMCSCAMSIRMFSITNQACHHVANLIVLLIYLMSHCHHLNTGNIGSARQSRSGSSSILSSCLTAVGYVPVCCCTVHQYCLCKKILSIVCACVLLFFSLNHKIRLNVFTIACVADLFNQLGKATVFSSLDLSHTYHQVKATSQKLLVLCCRVCKNILLYPQICATCLPLSNG